MKDDGRATGRSFARVAERLRSGEAVVAGCLSGTSADGIDVVLVRFAGDHGTDAARADAPGFEVLAFRTLPFERTLAGRVRAVLDGAPIDLAGVAVLSRDLGLAFGDAVRAVAHELGNPVDLVGSHGQTVWHHDGDASTGAATLQLGGGAFVARAANAPVVNDFRQADVAAGGEGAPLSALADPVLFAAAPRPTAILNLGGMANLTLLGEGPEPCLSAFDVGPAGSLLDGLARRLLDRPFDEGGLVAATGSVDEAWLAAILEHPFFDREPPKSTGRDTFGEPWVEALLARAPGSASDALGAADVLATAAEAIAASVAEALQRFAPTSVREIVVAGGGGHHGPLVRALERRAGRPVVPASRYGVDPDAREALLFAELARRAVLEAPSTSPAATGARPGAVLGALHPAPRT